jgi:hypothetical protein
VTVTRRYRKAKKPLQDYSLLASPEDRQTWLDSLLCMLPRCVNSTRKTAAAAHSEASDRVCTISLLHTAQSATLH